MEVTPPEAMTEAELEEIRARSEAATAGPWVSYVEGRDHLSGDSLIMTADQDIQRTNATVADQDFIAHARQDVPRLLAEVALLRRRP